MNYSLKMFPEAENHYEQSHLEYFARLLVKVAGNLGDNTAEALKLDFKSYIPLEAALTSAGSKVKTKAPILTNSLSSLLNGDYREDIENIFTRLKSSVPNLTALDLHLAYLGAVEEVIVEYELQREELQQKLTALDGEDFPLSQVLEFRRLEGRISPETRKQFVDCNGEMSYSMVLKKLTETKVNESLLNLLNYRRQLIVDFDNGQYIFASPSINNTNLPKPFLRLIIDND